MGRPEIPCTRLPLSSSSMMMNRLIRIATAILPLALAPLLLWLIAGGHIDLGGGEKDLVWILPWVLWSLVFAVSCFVLWWRGWTHARSLRRSALIGFGSVLLAGIILAAFGQLGIAGLF